MFREIFDNVRVRGKIDLKKELSVRDVLPIVYTGESTSDDATGYYNSGGRSILFQSGDTTYRVKGVDPFGYLTERVAQSPKNRIQNVRDARRILEENLGDRPNRDDLLFTAEKPFGTFYYEQAEKEMIAHRRLGTIYEHFEIEDPCVPLFHKETGIPNRERKTYQTAFRLPSPETDLRTYEIMSLITERLDTLTPEEIAARSKNIGRLMGRFIYWAGANTGIFARAGVLPIDSSFYPQNWVISRYKQGYGIFRVDHTSTIQADPETILQNLTRKKDGLPFILNEFSVFGSRVQVASAPQRFIPGQNLRFSQILELTRINGDESRVIAAHAMAFGMGLESTLVRNNIEPIPEDMFLEALR